MSLRRPSQGRILGGVCQGFAERFEVDVTLLRLAFLVLTLAWGIGALLYVALWLLLPGPDDDPSIALSSRARERFRGARFDLDHSANQIKTRWARLDRDPWPRPLGRRWLGLTLVAIGTAFLLATVGAFSWLNGARAIAIAVIIAGGAILVSMRREAS